MHQNQQYHTEKYKIQAKMTTKQNKTIKQQNNVSSSKILAQKSQTEQKHIILTPTHKITKDKQNGETNAKQQTAAKQQQSIKLSTYQIVTTNQT